MEIVTTILKPMSNVTRPQRKFMQVLLPLLIEQTSVTLADTAIIMRRRSPVGIGVVLTWSNPSG